MSVLTPEQRVQWREDAEERQPLATHRHNARILALLDALDEAERRQSEAVRDHAEALERIRSEEWRILCGVTGYEPDDPTEDDPRTVYTEMVEQIRRPLTSAYAIAASDRAALSDTYADLTSRLGFGDGITEPQADNDTIVTFFEQQQRDAAEWRESQLWRDACHDAGHPDDEDCAEHDPARRLDAAEARVAELEAEVAQWRAEATDEYPDGSDL